MAAPLLTLPGEEEIAALRTRQVHETAMMRARVAEAAEEGRTLVPRQTWAPLEAIAPAVVSALVASEDARFFEHDGVDLKEIHAAIRDDVAQGKLARGASTLTQQVAKNLWLSEDKSLVRKLKELVLASRLERLVGKRRILALYLNIAEWGEGVFGVEEAARSRYGKSAKELSVEEAATLVAMLPAPRKLALPENREALQKRTERVLGRMKAEGFIQ